nr:MAG TPA: N-6 DNA Methylase [Caudoviricetes sp.]
MTILQRIMEELNIREMHEIPTALTKVLLNSNTCSVLLKSIQPYYSYEALLAEFEEHSADRKNYKQDYTPQCVLDIIGGITSGGDVRDVCAGIGGLSLAKVKSDNTVTLRLEEYSKNAIAFMLLNLLIANIDAEVVEKNVLTGEELAYYKVESAATGFGQVSKVDMLESKKYDTVISNPPYSQSWIPQMDERFEGYKLAPKSKADFAFILDGLYSLNASGTSAFILPNGVLFRGQAEGDIRRKLIEDNLLDAVIGLPSNLFTNTSIPVCILVFKKNRANKDVLFIDAQKDFVKNKNKNKNIMTAEQVEKVIKAYKNRADIERYSSNISMSTILDNDYNLNIPRYIDSFEPEEIPDAVQLAKELNEINRESRTLGLEIAEMLKQLVCTDPDSQKEHDEFVKEFTEFLISSESAVTVEEQEAVIKKIEDVKKYLLQKMFV